MYGGGRLPGAEIANGRLLPREELPHPSFEVELVRMAMRYGVVSPA